MLPSLAASAVDLTPQAVVVHNYVPSYVQRGGAPTIFGVGSKLTDPRNRRGEAPVGKYAEENFVELWFPYAKPVTVDRLRFRMGNHRPVRHRVQTWDEAAWRTVVRVDESNPVGTDIRFEPVATRGVRLLIDKTYYIGFDSHRLGGISVSGPTPVDEQPPEVEWDFSTQRELNVFALGEDVVVKARLEAPDGCRLTWEWLDWYLRPVANGGSREVTTPDQIFRWTPQAQGPYFLRATLWRHRAVASQAIFLVGVRDVKMAESLEVAPYRPRRGGRIRDEADLIGAGRMVFSSETYHHMSRLHYLPPEVWFQQFAKSNVEIVGALMNLEALMPLPGVYNFAGLDHVVDLAERHGLRLEAGFWRYWFKGPNRPHWWLEDELIVDHAGKPGSGFEHAFSYWGPRYRKHIHQAVQLVVRRYREHPTVAIWNFQPFGHVDWGWMGKLDRGFDYSTFSQQAFRRFLREQLGFDLPALRARYGLKPQAMWDSVALPTPLWTPTWKSERTDHLLDTRPIWLDFVRYRHWTCASSAQEVYDLIRALDPVRPLGTWMSIMAGYGEQWQQLCSTYGIPGSNGAQWTEYTRMSLAQRRAGRDSRQEHGGQIDARRADPIWEMHNMIFNNNLFKTKYFNFVFPTFEQNSAWWDVFANQRCRQILTDMCDAEIPRAPIGALHSYDSNWFEGRNSYAFIELDRWWRMLAWGTYMTADRWIEWYSNAGDLSDIGDLKLLVDNHSRVMRPEAEQALYDYVLTGGNLVLWSNSGEVTYGETERSWRLLRLLGYQNVEGLKATKARGELKPLPGNGLFSFDSVPVGDWAALNKPGAKVLATIDGQPGAITWQVGKGRVLLISGEEGAPDILSLIETRQRDPKQYWPARTAGRVRFIDTALPLYRDLVRFAGELPAPIAEVTGAVRWYHKQNGDDYHVLCFLNQTETPLTGLRASLRLQPGTYSLQWWSLAGYDTFGGRSAEQLSAGLELPPIPPKRMRILRVTRAR